eukprot:454203-Rhodomonas_salina.1
MPIDATYPGTRVPGTWVPGYTGTRERGCIHSTSGLGASGFAGHNTGSRVPGSPGYPGMRLKGTHILYMYPGTREPGDLGESVRAFTSTDHESRHNFRAPRHTRCCIGPQGP